MFDNKVGRLVFNASLFPTLAVLVANRDNVKRDGNKNIAIKL